MKKLYVILYIALLSSSISEAQNAPEEICGYQNEVNKILAKQPNFLKLQDAWFQEAMTQYKQLQSAKRTIKSDTLYFEIPVVFHIIYNTTQQNVSDAMVNSQITELNQAFRKLTADTSRIRSIFKPIAGDVKIQFKLATIDPQGNPTSGITRTNTTQTTFATSRSGAYNTNMKRSNVGGKDAWDPTRYLNFWICNMEYPNYVGIVYGFATPPTGAPNWGGTGVTKDVTDGETGVVIHYKVLGKNNPLAPGKYTEGKVAVHEVGHYLGMRHIWGDGSATTGCSVDDGIFDTPNAKQANASCTGQNTCTDASNDKPDQTENYMDYALDGCAAMFTKEQAFMMQYVLKKLRPQLPKAVLPIVKTGYPKYINPEFLIKDTIFEIEESKVTNIKEGYAIYPNPSIKNKDLTVEIGSKISANFTVCIIDLNGKTVIEKSIPTNTSQKIGTTGIAQGLYTIIIRDQNGDIVHRQLHLFID